MRVVAETLARARAGVNAETPAAAPP